MATGYVGERVRWLGPPQNTGFITPAYWAAVDAGEQRLPTAEERPALATGEHGTVTELVRVDEGGHTYVIVFDGGHEIEAVLPAPTLIGFVNHPTGAAPAGSVRRYAAAPARRRTPLGQLVHGLLRAVRLTADAR